MNVLVTVKHRVRPEEDRYPAQILVLDCPDLSAMPPSYLEGVLHEHFHDSYEIAKVQDVQEVITGRRGVLHGVAIIRTNEGE